MTLLSTFIIIIKTLRREKHIAQNINDSFKPWSTHKFILFGTPQSNTVLPWHFTETEGGLRSVFLNPFLVHMHPTIQLCLHRDTNAYTLLLRSSIIFFSWSVLQD